MDSLEDKFYRDVAQSLWAIGNDEIDIDSNATVSVADGGAWVAAWVWVAVDDECDCVPAVAIPSRVEGGDRHGNE